MQYMVIASGDGRFKIKQTSKIVVTIYPDGLDGMLMFFTMETFRLI